MTNKTLNPSKRLYALKVHVTDSYHLNPKFRLLNPVLAVSMLVAFLLVLGTGAVLASYTGRFTTSTPTSQAHRDASASAYRQPTKSTSSEQPSALCYSVGFATAVNYGVGISPHSVAVGDFDADGNQDLAVANQETNNTSILLGTGIGTFLPPTNFETGTEPTSVAVGDFNADGNQDLAVANSVSDNISILLGTGTGTFGAPTNFGASNAPYLVAVGDFDADGNQDLVTTNYNSYYVTVLLGTGTGTFGTTHNFLTGTRPFFVAVGYFNADGNQDLAVANWSSNNVSILLGTGIGTFLPPTNFPTGTEPTSVAVGDFDADGKQDLAVANGGSNNVSILLGTGTGTFGAPTNFGVDAGPRSVAVGDFDADGKQDLVTNNFLSGNVSVLPGTGMGTFWAATNFPASSAPQSLAIGDFNDDARQDLAIANYGSHNVSVLLGNCPNCTLQFEDVLPENSFYPFVRCLACRGIITGYPCGGADEPCNSNKDPYFRPGNNLTRGQLAKIVSQSVGLSGTPRGQSFEDVPGDNTFYLFVERLYGIEAISGYPCGGTNEPCGSESRPYYRPGANVTRGQLTKIVSNAAGFTDPAPGTYTFTDVPVGSTFHIYVERLLLNRPGVMGGYPCGAVGEPCDGQNRPYFRVNANLTRGQTSKIVGNTFFPGCVTPAK